MEGHNQNRGHIGVRQVQENSCSPTEHGARGCLVLTANAVVWGNAVYGPLLEGLVGHGWHVHFLDRPGPSAAIGHAIRCSTTRDQTIQGHLAYKGRTGGVGLDQADLERPTPGRDWQQPEGRTSGTPRRENRRGQDTHLLDQRREMGRSR